MDLAIRTLYNEARVVIAPKGDPMANRGSISWRDLAREQWILSPPRTPISNEPALDVNLEISQFADNVLGRCLEASRQIRALMNFKWVAQHED